LPFARGPGIRGLDTPMLIVVDGGDDVQRYAREFSALAFPRPPACPRCAVAGHLIGHGSYPRTVADPIQAVAIRIKRLLCTACRHTLSLLPTFCLPCRHYATATIQAVLTVRVEAHGSWREARARFHPAEVPTLTTCREWVDVFRSASSPYLARLLQVLASDPLHAPSPELLLADLAALPPGPAQLVGAVPHLLSWLQGIGRGAPDGNRRWLATLWQWGSGLKLGRLV
jgi:hypothetical protein